MNENEKPAKKRSKVGELPEDAPYLSFEDAARYLRMTPAAFRTVIHGRSDGYDQKLGDRLREWLVTLSSHRRFIKRQPFMKWLDELGDKEVA